MKNHWVRFEWYEGSVAVFFMFNIVLDELNKELLNMAIPNVIVSYSFWLSLGLFLGFQLCKYECKRVVRKFWAEDEESKRKDEKQTQ